VRWNTVSLSLRIWWWSWYIAHTHVFRALTHSTSRASQKETNNAQRRLSFHCPFYSRNGKLTAKEMLIDKMYVYIDTPGVSKASSLRRFSISRWCISRWAQGSPREPNESSSYRLARSLASSLCHFMSSGTLLSIWGKLWTGDLRHVFLRYSSKRTKNKM
jgi:hypothetical protein